jgi:hypothetical protein
MGWAGSGALIAWHDVEEGHEAEYLDWHSHEHMKERLAIPGFPKRLTENSRNASRGCILAGMGSSIRSKPDRFPPFHVRGAPRRHPGSSQ